MKFTTEEFGLVERASSNFAAKQRAFIARGSRPSGNLECASEAGEARKEFKCQQYVTGPNHDIKRTWPYIRFEHQPSVYIKPRSDNPLVRNVQGVSDHRERNDHGVQKKIRRSGNDSQRWFRKGH